MNELANLERIVSKDLAVALRMESAANPIAVNYLMEDFPKYIGRETDRIKEKIMAQACDALHVDELQQYVRQNQNRLVQLCSKLLRYTEVDKLVGSPDL